MNPCDLSLAAASAALRARHCSAVELTEAFLARARVATAALNCFLTLDDAGALAAARASDARRAAGNEIGRLDGIPLAHKDLFDRAGAVTGFGARLLAGRVATATATVLGRLDRAGAIDGGRLHLAEFAAGATGHNRHHGDCRNPWDRARTPGGSSSGSAVAVAARAVWASLGSDTGGSIRLPAHFCGVTGLRPTYGRVSRAGVLARSWSQDCIGPLARTVEDAALLFGAIAGADPDDPTAETVPVPDCGAALARPIRGLRIGVPENAFFDDIDPGIARLLDDALAALRRAGAEIVRVAVPDPARYFGLALIVAKAEAAALHQSHIRERPGDFDHGIREEMEGGFFVPAVDYIQALRHRGALLREFLAAAFARADALFTPVYDRPTPSLADCAPLSGERAQRVMATFGKYTRPFSYLGLPALAVPCGFQADGMPAAFQLVGRPFDEATLFALGHAYQRDTAWHERAPVLP